MSHVLVRGIPVSMHRRIKHLAGKENLSVNQEILRLLKAALEKEEERNEGKKEEMDVYERIREFRERMAKKYGKQEDSTKYIREDRDSR